MPTQVGTVMPTQVGTHACGDATTRTKARSSRQLFDPRQSSVYSVEGLDADLRRRDGWIKPLGDPPIPSEQRQIQIRPFRVHDFDQPYLPGSMPVLELLFPLDCRKHLLMPLKPNQPGQPVVPGEACASSCSMLISAPNQIGRDADIQRTVRPVRHDVDVSATHGVTRNLNPPKGRLIWRRSGRRRPIGASLCREGVDADRRRHDEVALQSGVKRTGMAKQR